MNFNQFDTTNSIVNGVEGVDVCIMFILHRHGILTYVGIGIYFNSYA